MKGSSPSSVSTGSIAPADLGFSPWQRLKTKRISYLTIPLLVMATITEFVILATGWKYQQIVCLPQGMGVTFFGIGPIGATILAVELLKLPLAIWTASRHGWQKSFMLLVGLPLICVLTFQLVKDMAVYEMGVAMTPAGQMLEKASAEEVKIAQLNGELAAIEGKRSERERRLADLAAKETKAKADLEESIKRNDAARQDAISLTDYQKKELSEVQSRESAIIQQFNADTEQINKAIADLRARREVEVGRATKWNAEEARIENDYKGKMAEYANRKAAYDKAKAEYDGANFLKRQLMKEPISPGVPPEREVNTILKPTLVAELDTQVKAKEAELLAINNRRRDSIAQVETDARRLREEFDHRSGAKREEADKKREELSAALASISQQGQAERTQIDKEFETVLQKVDAIHADIDASRKRAEGYYEAREASIRKTQVHRIATTVEIVRGLIKGERPMSITMTAKQRGDILTDQISMVRIWVYPVLAFIVAFLPTLMVEIGFSTVFQPEQQRPPHRLGFLGRRLHWLYTRAGRVKILRAERQARESSAAITARDQALAASQAVADKALGEKDTELQTTREALDAANALREQQVQQLQEQFAAQAKTREDEWVSKLAAMADTLTRTVAEKDGLRDLQRSEIERQVQLRQNAWSDRLTQLRQELDHQREASEAERAALMQEHHKKIQELTEESKNQVTQARRQAADVEMGGMEKTAQLAHDLKQALHARDEAETQLKQQADTFGSKLAQAKEDGARELDKAARQEKHRLERQQLEFAKTLRQREDAFEHQLQQRQQELTLGFEARLAEDQSRADQEARRREADLERQFEARTVEIETRWKQELQQREDAAQVRLRQREQQLQAQAETRVSETQTQAEQELRRRESDSERQAESRVRAVETRFGLEAQQKEELFQAKLRQRDQQWQVKLDAARGEVVAQQEESLRRREAESEAARRELETQLRKEMQQKEEAAQVAALGREQDLVTQLTSQAESRLAAARSEWEAEADERMRSAMEPFKGLLARTQEERDQARQSAAEASRQVQTLKNKLSEASSFLNGWRNGNSLVEST